MKYIFWLLIWLGLFSVRLNSSLQANRVLDQMAGKEIRLVGRISSEPILEGNFVKFKIGRVRVVAKDIYDLEYGQKVALTGSLLKRVLTKHQTQFSLLYPQSLEILSCSDCSRGFRQSIILIRKDIERVYNRVLPEPEASLLSGIVLGVKQNMPQKFYDQLQKTGTLHIVVASGFNVTIVLGTVVMYLAGWVKRRTAVWLGMGAVIIYSLMAGAEPAIIRAAIMGSLAYFGQVLGKKADGLRLLLLAGGVMLLFKPMLIWDIGFQLSVLATSGLILISPLLNRFFKRIWGIGKDISETISAQIAVWPILVINFNQLSVFAILVNSLILWLVPIIMVLGAVLGLIGWVHPLIAQLIGWLVYGPLHLMVLVIDWFSKPAFVSLEIKDLSWFWGGFYYLALGLGLFLIYRKKGVKSEL